MNKELKFENDYNYSEFMKDTDRKPQMQHRGQKNTSNQNKKGNTMSKSIENTGDEIDKLQEGLNAVMPVQTDISMEEYQQDREGCVEEDPVIDEEEELEKEEEEENNRLSTPPNLIVNGKGAIENRPFKSLLKVGNIMKRPNSLLGFVPAFKGVYSSINSGYGKGNIAYI